jgi:hypothetical protein
MRIELKEYGQLFSDQNTGDIIYERIIDVIKSHEKCIVDFDNIISMATFNAKQIFGRLYLELGSEDFFKKIEIRNASNDIKLIIQLGIQSALDDEKN